MVKGTDNIAWGSWDVGGNTHEVTDWRNDGQAWISEQVNFNESDIGKSASIRLSNGSDVLTLGGTVVRQ